ncbi:MAG: ParB N-terminal domain-containing protein [bacterium]
MAKASTGDGAEKPKRTTTRAPRATAGGGRRKKAAVEPASRGLRAPELAGEAPPAEISALVREIENDGGSVLGTYRDPLGGHWQVLAGLPIEQVAPTPFQRDLSEAHANRLTKVIDKIGRFLDPVIAMRQGERSYWTPNGNHRLSAMNRLGARAIVALVLPDPAVAYKILALNTEKAHALREKALEVIRMARSLAASDGRTEADFALEFEEPALLTLGLCYEERPRFGGGAYHALLNRVDGFIEEPMSQALEIRAERARRVLALEEAVVAAMAALKERGFESPYLRAFVVARVNPIRFYKGSEAPPFDATLDRMIAAARRFDAGSVNASQLARASGPPEE